MESRSLLLVAFLVLSVFEGCARHPHQTLQPAVSPDAAEQRVLGRRCGTEVRTITGTVVTRQNDGSLRPVTDLKVSEVWVEWGNTSDWKPIDVEVDAQGHFQFLAALPHSVVFEVIGEESTDRSEVWVPRHYMLQSPSCDDQLIEVDENWHPQEIVLACNG